MAEVSGPGEGVPGEGGPDAAFSARAGRVGAKGRPKAGKPPKPKPEPKTQGKAGRRRPKAGPERPAPRRRGFPSRAIRWLVRTAVRLIVLAVVVVLVWVAAYRVIDPPWGPYMLAERARLGAIEREWRDLGAISPDLARAVVAAEDARFCAHGGIDLDAVEEAVADWRETGRLRGASTITQQVAKNVFLWHGRSLARKGLEAGFAVLIEALWTKRRILEIYLNVAEFGEGVFGAEAAARRHFGVSAQALGLDRASRLASVLPNPKARDPAALGPSLRARARQIAAGARTIEARGDDACFR